MSPLLALVLLAGPLPAASPELRGLWVVRTGLVSPEIVDRTVDQARAAGFNALFVQVRGRGDAFYRSRLVPRSALLSGEPADFDPLDRLLARAHAAGLQVHAWVNVLLSAHFTQPLSAGHVLFEHPEWVMVPRRLARLALLTPPDRLLDLVRGERGHPDVEGLYLSPSAPGLPERLEEVLRELLRTYPVDGLHLDFIRYPNAEYDYSRVALAGFRARLREAPEDLLEGPRREAVAWDAYRRETLTSLVVRLVRSARTTRPGLRVSAAVVADGVDAAQHKFQSWPAWARDGLLDAVCPMAYTPDARVFRRQLDEAVASAGGATVWGGIGAYRLELPAIVENVRAARRSGASGVVLFSHESLGPDALAKLRAQVFVDPAVTPGGEKRPAIGSPVLSPGLERR